MRWIEFPDPALPVFGLWWFEANSPDLIRLPKDRRERFRPAVWGLAQSPAGGRIRFRSDTTRLAIRLDYGTVGHMNNMCRIGQHSVDCFVDDVYWNNASPLQGEPLVEVTYFGGVPATMRQIDLYLPLYHAVKVLAVGVDDAANITAPVPFAVPRPVLFYGSSITQGGCASRAGNSYEAFVCRWLNLDHVNLGFSGNGRGELEVAEAVAEVDAAAFVIDYSQNCPTIDELAETYPPFLQTIRARHPQTPILCITPISAAGEVWNSSHRNMLNAKREVIRKAVAARVAAGDARIQVLEGPDLLPLDACDGIVDSSHPNDLGFWHIANALRRPLAGALGL